MNFLRAVGAIFAQPLFQRPCAQLPPHDPHNDAWSLTVKYFPGGDRGSRWTLNGSVEWGRLNRLTPTHWTSVQGRFHRLGAVSI